jgi:DNA (cytosine-5)-methyltransferase 1
MTQSAMAEVLDFEGETDGGWPLDEIVVRQRRLEGTLPKLPKNRLIDLFSGAGGLSLGFSPAFGHDFSVVFANDFDAAAAATYNRNLGEHCVPGDILSLLESDQFEVPKADLVIGGPPCQGFSLLNKQRAEDPRKQLWRPFMRFVELSDADAFVMENVPQLLGSGEFDQIIAEARRLGFTVRWTKLLAADFGVPQARLRAFVLGSRSVDPATSFPPTPTHYPPDEPVQEGIFQRRFAPAAAPWRTVQDAIGDLSPPTGTEFRETEPPYDLHFGRNPTEVSKRRYRAIPEPGMNRFDLLERAPDITPDCWKRKKSGGTDLFGRLWWDRPSVTIRTEFFKPEKGRYLHPEQHRPITHREAARFQSFPDSFKFVGSKIEVARQIGNAVPPALAARLADSVYAVLARSLPR